MCVEDYCRKIDEEKSKERCLLFQMRSRADGKVADPFFQQFWLENHKEDLERF